MPTTLRTDNRRAEVTMLPVTAGDATLLVWSDSRTTHTVLVDAGLRENDAVSYLQSIGIFHLDLIILSHPDLDHLGGLLAILKSRAMSVDRIWCFDLTFLREFIQTGTIPPPGPATREVIYDYQLRSTLDEFSDILKTANGKGVQVLQVSEGYRLCLGGLFLEVLYPPQGFYDALHSPIAIKRMLSRKLPDDWYNDRGEREHGKARPVSGQEQEERLTEMVSQPEMPEDGVHLSDIPEESQDEDHERGEREEEEKGSERLPWRMVGTLYNNLSIVVKTTVLGGMSSPSVLFPGDLSDWTTLLLRQWPNLRADVLKMPHHGSKDVTCDLEAVRDAVFPWYLFPAKLSRAQWRQFIDVVHRGDPLSVIRDIVSPSHVLVFPHPQHRLPSVLLGKIHANIIANRTNRALRALSLKGNAPRPARISLGVERQDVTEIKF